MVFFWFWFFLRCVIFFFWGWDFCFGACLLVWFFTNCGVFFGLSIFSLKRIL